MKRIDARAHAKVNLTLHVTGQRADGYHLLDSLVVFAGVADTISATASAKTSLAVGGMFRDGVPTDESNLILRAAATLARARSVTQGAALTLDKMLPHAAGIGSGSADAAASLRLLAGLWDVLPLDPDDPAVLALGADVPVCLHAPQPMRMSGIGERLAPVARLPRMGIVLVRPPVAVPTGPVFQRLARKDGNPMEAVPEGADFGAFCAWLSRQRNDLQGPAIAIAPVIGDAIARLRVCDAAGFAGMSGSGATCFALFPDLAGAMTAAEVLSADHPDWWVAAADVLGG